MKILIPTQDKPNGFHKGHEALIEFGKSMGDVTVAVHYDLVTWNKYLLNGDITQPDKMKSEKTESDIRRFRVKAKSFGLARMNERKRMVLLQKATAFLKPFEKDLLLHRYVDIVRGTIMRTMTRSKTTTDVILRGPEVVPFFLKYIGDRHSQPREEIFPFIIKNDISGIKLQSNLELVAPQRVRGIKRIIRDASKFYRVGLNQKLAEELTASHEDEDFRIHDIAVYEGGFVKGRIEVTGFSIRGMDGRWVFLEDVEYYA